MKKVMFLGGSQFQIAPIKKAKEMGLYAITCDYYPNNPGHKLADEYHNVSTTDKEGVLKVARACGIDGIVCYASDVSAATAAYVAENLGLSTSPFESTDLLTSKDKFREFLRKNDFNTPKSQGYASNEIDRAKVDLKSFKLPVMVKPVDSAGSKGVSKVDNAGQLQAAIDAAMPYSRCKRFIIEEYIEKKGYQIAGDGFSVDGKLVFRCFANEHFDASGINPYVPIGESWPYVMPRRVHDKIHAEIQRAISLLGMKTQAYNFDIRIDDEENVFIMEIGPRNGGNLIPQVTKYVTGVDMVEYTIKAALGQDCSDLHMVEPKGFWSCYMIHSQSAGILDEVSIDEKFRENNIVEYDMLYKPGDTIDAFVGANGALGTMILKYSSQDEMLAKMDNMEKWVKVKTR